VSDSSHSYILMSVGPVQGYINQARRTQDLFAGSRILSYLVWQGLKFLKDKGEVIYPSGEFTQETLGNIPNRFLCRVSSDQAIEIAGGTKEEIESAWKDVAARVKEHLLRDIKIPDKIWKRQVTPDSWLEVRYVIVPDTGDYRADQRNANERLAARKLLRDFKQQDEPGYKCTVTGEHEALHNAPEGTRETSEHIKKFWDEVRAKVPNKALISSSEQMGAPATIRRFAHEQNATLQVERFPSTSSIASLPFRKKALEQWYTVFGKVKQFLEKLESLFPDHRKDSCEKSIYFTKNGSCNQEVFPALEHLIEHLKSPRHQSEHHWLTKFMSLDGSFLYQEGLTAKALADYTKEKSAKDKLIPIQSALQELHRAVGIKPSDYLAILSMDGDDMGSQAEHFFEAQEHTLFSGKLIDFGRDTIPDIVETQNTGRVIYAGGDDLLAVLPVREALPVAQSIATEFTGLQTDLGLSISAGIAFVHRTHNLQAAIRAARAAQKRAKSLPGKAAFGIEFLRRSGEAYTCQMYWNVDGVDVVDTLQEVERYMRGGELARQLPHDLQDFLYAMVSPLTRGDAGASSYDWPLIPNVMREAEFSRVFRRRCDSTAFRKSPVAGKLLADLIAIGQSRQEGQNWPHLVTLLRLMRFISQQSSAETITQTEQDDVAVD
jgi:CRISPR-associated protein Cmr2